MQTSSTVRPAGGWYLLPAGMVVLAAALVALAVTQFVGFAGSDFQRYQPGSSITATTDGFTVYAAPSTTAGRSWRCTATGAQGDVALHTLQGVSTVTNDQGTFGAVASTPDGFTPGHYTLSCRSDGAEVADSLWVGPRATLSTVWRLAVVGVLIPVLLVLAAFVVFLVLLVRRHRWGRRQAATEPRDFSRHSH